MEHMYGIVLAGGSGKRLWPLSRHAMPKQLIPFGHTSLLAQALHRLKEIPFITLTGVVTTASYAAEVRKKSDSGTLIIEEPVPKNTAAAILLSCLQIAARDAQALVTFIPADHVISPQGAFSSAICTALSYVSEHDSLALIGVTPTHASTSYGYIERATADTAGPVVSFHEKPSAEVAERYITQSSMLWNCGIFCARVGVFIELFMKHMPELYAQVKEGRYADIVPISFDKGIVEKVHDAVVVHGLFSWTDVGTLEQFIDQSHKEELPKNVITLDAHNVRVYAQDKLVVVYGLENICVIQTDDALVVMHSDYCHRMDRVVDHLHTKGYEEYL